MFVFVGSLSMLNKIGGGVIKVQDLAPLLNDHLVIHK